MRRAPAARSRRAHRPRRPARVLLVGLVAACALVVTGCFGAAEPGAPGLITSMLGRRPLAGMGPGLPPVRPARLHRERLRSDLGPLRRRRPSPRARGGSRASTAGSAPPARAASWAWRSTPRTAPANLRAYVCYSTTTDNRVARFDLNPGATPAISNWTVIIQGIPHNPGFHNGCRVRFQPGTGALFVSTGDAGTATAPQDDNSLGGKILRMTTDGTAWPGNASGKLWYSKGHRNPQGIAFRPGSNDPYSVEHGPDVNDEVNKLVNGGNAGWNPNDGAGGYDQSKPMTGPGATAAPDLGLRRRHRRPVGGHVPRRRAVEDVERRAGRRLPRRQPVGRPAHARDEPRRSRHQPHAPRGIDARDPPAAPGTGRGTGRQPVRRHRRRRRRRRDLEGRPALTDPRGTRAPVATLTPCPASMPRSTCCWIGGSRRSSTW